MEGEPLSMVPGDIKEENFLIDPSTGSVTIVNFGRICVLPLSFVSFTLQSTSATFVRRIAEFLSWEKSKNLTAMNKATWIYWLKTHEGKTFDKLHIQPLETAKLTVSSGLDKNGLPSTRAYI